MILGFNEECTPRGLIVKHIIAKHIQLNQKHHNKPNNHHNTRNQINRNKINKIYTKLIPIIQANFNYTHALTRCIQQKMPYTPARGGLLTLINNKYAYPGNITKIPTLAVISPYLQIKQIQNTPLQPWLILHMYMPSNLGDIQYITTIQQQITQQIIAHPNHSYVLCGDFNIDIVLIGRQNETSVTTPQTEDKEWRTFIDTQNLTYIPINSTFTRHGGQNYTQTSLIDGYYIQTPNNTLYTSTTKHDYNLNSYHSPVTLQIPPNTLLARPTQPKVNKPPRILNPIPQENIEKLKILFFEENSLRINELTTILMNEQLTDNQWQTSCTKIDHLINP